MTGKVQGKWLNPFNRRTSASLHSHLLQDSGCFQHGLHAGSAAVVIDDISDLVVGGNGLSSRHTGKSMPAGSISNQAAEATGVGVILDVDAQAEPGRSHPGRVQGALSSVGDGTRLQSAAAPGAAAACKRQTSAGPASAFYRAKAAEASRLATSLWRSSSSNCGCSVAGSIAQALIATANSRNNISVQVDAGRSIVRSQRHAACTSLGPSCWNKRSRRQKPEPPADEAPLQQLWRGPLALVQLLRLSSFSRSEPGGFKVAGVQGIDDWQSPGQVVEPPRGSSHPATAQVAAQTLAGGRRRLCTATSCKTPAASSTGCMRARRQ